MSPPNTYYGPRYNRRRRTAYSASKYKPRYSTYRRGNRSTGMFNTAYPRRANMGSQITAVNGVGPVGSKFITTLKYAQNNYTATTIGFNYLFNLNSLFDPDRTATGHQPYGFDQLAALYARYRVFRCRWIIKAVSETTGGEITMNGQVVPQNHAAVPASYGAGMEQPRVVNKLIGPASRPETTWIGSIYLPELTGETSEQYRTNDLNTALTNANPATVMCLRFTTENPSNTLTNVNWNCTLEYDCEFFDPVTLGQS